MFIEIIMTLSKVHLLRFGTVEGKKLLKGNQWQDLRHRARGGMCIHLRSKYLCTMQARLEMNYYLEQFVINGDT